MIVCTSSYSFDYILRAVNILNISQDHLSCPRGSRTHAFIDIELRFLHSIDKAGATGLNGYSSYLHRDGV